MNSLANRDPYRLGLIGVGSLLVFAILLTFLSTLSFGKKTYTAHIAHTAGLRVGEDVQVAGVNVGSVKGIELTDKSVEVTFEMDSGIPLGAQTTGEVRVATLLGTHYFQVTPQGTGNLPGDSIPLEQTTVPYNLQDVIDGGTAALNEVNPKLLARALTVMSKVTEESQEEFGPALRGIARVSTVITKRTQQAGDLLEAARGVSDQLSDNTEDIIGLMQQTNLVLNEILARRAAISSLLTKATALGKAINAIITQTRGDLDQALDNTRVVLRLLKQEDDTLRRALTDLAPAVRYIANASGSGPWLSTYAYSLNPDPFICAQQGSC